MRGPLIADASTLIEQDRRGALAEYLAGAERQGFTVHIPRAIREELVDEPRRLARAVRGTRPALARRILASAKRFEDAMARGALRVERIDYRRHGKAIDEAHRYLGKLEEARKDLLKKGDAEFIGLVVQMAADRRGAVTVQSSDRNLLKVLGAVARGKGVQCEVRARV